jgi:hypothetical protein
MVETSTKWTHALARTSAATSPPTQTLRHPGKVLGKMVMSTRLRREEISEMMMFSIGRDDHGLVQ